jgi:DnaJ-domain-containing protein 1
MIFGRRGQDAQRSPMSDEPSVLEQLVGFHAPGPSESRPYDEWAVRLRQRRRDAQRLYRDESPATGDGYWQPEHLFANSEPDATDGSVDRAAVSQAFDRLRLSPDAPPVDVTARYRELVKVHHPDRHVDADECTAAWHAAEFRALHDALTVLRRAGAV